jgi:hypothetical protein
MPRRKDVRQIGESLGDYCERLRFEKAAHQKENVNAVFGNWLADLGHTWKWDWFATFSFSDHAVTPDGAHYFFRRYLGWIENEGLAVPFAFRADEYGPQNGRFHIHALIGNVSHLTHYCGNRLQPGQWGKKCCWLHRWPCGIARILPYEPEKGAEYYLTKYVTKKLGDYELLGFETDSLRFSQRIPL